MRIVALILSFMIFHQSMDVCAHDLGRAAMEHHQDNDNSIQSSDQKTHCCAAKTQKEDHEKNDKNDHKHCNGDFCKCISCIKVFLTDTSVSIDLKLTNVILDTKVNQFVSVHSFDFNPNLKHPPRV